MFKLVQIQPRFIAAAYEFQAKEDSRYYLNGMLIEKDYLVATDGAGMLVANLGSDDGIRTHDIEHDVIVSLPSKFVTECRQLKHRADSYANLAFDFDTGEHYAYMTGGSHHPFTIVDGTFPSWRSVVESQKHNGEEAQVFTMNARLLIAAAKAAKLLAPDNIVNAGVFFEPRTMEATSVRFHHAPEVFAVLMPLREETYEAGNTPKILKAA